jgi:uncharacterized membrane protein
LAASEPPGEIPSAAEGPHELGNKSKRAGTPGLAPPRTRRPRSLLHTAFEAGIALKGLDGLLEVVGAVLLWRVNPATVNRIVAALTQHELSEDPHDFVARHLVEASKHFGQGQRLFAALYLLVHGVVKVVLVAALWRNKLWAYPAMIAVIVAFIGYQLYRLERAPTLLLVALTLFDVVVVWLTWAEYRRVRLRRE